MFGKRARSAGAGESHPLGGSAFGDLMLAFIASDDDDRGAGSAAGAELISNPSREHQSGPTLAQRESEDRGCRVRSEEDEDAVRSGGKVAKLIRLDSQVLLRFY